MKQVQISEKAGRQIVVFDQLDVTYPGGAVSYTHLTLPTNSLV